MSSDLVIPDAAREEWFHCGCEAGCDRAGFQAGALPIVVAAELRRIANVGYWCDDTDISQEVDRVLRARADELDPPARQED